MKEKHPTVDELFQQGMELLKEAKTYDPVSYESANLAALAAAHFAAAEATVVALSGSTGRVRILNARWGQ
jgi:hypothetical protein